MKEFCLKNGRNSGVKRSLIASMFGKGVVVSTDLLQKYLEMELEVEDIEWVLEYNPRKCFEWFQDEVIRDRRLGDIDPNHKVIAETSKTRGNSFYGTTLLNKSRHTSLKFVPEEKLQCHIRNPLFKCMEELNGNIYEIEKSKKKVIMDLPIQIGISIYNHAKLILINFWEFLNKYLDYNMYEIVQCDTDSLYIALGAESIDDCVKPELKEEWHRVKHEFFSSEDNTLVRLPTC